MALNTVEYLYETLGLVLFLIVSLIFVKTPDWVTRLGKSLVTWLDRWI